jgi:hypothetical protein
MSGNRLDAVSTVIESTRPENTELDQPNSLLGELIESKQVQAILYCAMDVMEKQMRQHRAKQRPCRKEFM